MKRPPGFARRSSWAWRRPEAAAAPGITYFFEVDNDRLSRVPQVKLYPGMPVEATSSRATELCLPFFCIAHRQLRPRLS